MCCVNAGSRFRGVVRTWYDTEYTGSNWARFLTRSSLIQTYSDIVHIQVGEYTTV
jgi:hypothetical protein